MKSFSFAHRFVQENIFRRYYINLCNTATAISIVLHECTSTSCCSSVLILLFQLVHSCTFSEITAAVEIKQKKNRKQKLTDNRIIVRTKSTNARRFSRNRKLTKRPLTCEIFRYNLEARRLLRFLLFF